MSRRIDRRTVLKGLGAAVALPWLEAMAPRRLGRPGRQAAAAAPPSCTSPTASTCRTGPRRSRGAFRTAARPSSRSRRSRTTSSCSAAWPWTRPGANGDGPGDHARAHGRVPDRPPAAQDRRGRHPRRPVSVDQWIASQVGEPDQVLVAGDRHRGRPAGRATATPGYSCAYSSNISWRTTTTPMRQGGQPAAGLRPPLRQRHGQGRRRQSREQARPLQQEHPRLRHRGRQAARERPRRRPTSARWTST